MLFIMKASVFTALIAAAGVFGAVFAQAQYKSPRSYLRPGSGGAPANGGQPPQANANQAGAPGMANRPGQPAKPQPPKFKELPLNTPFYFASDTNHAFSWMKVSSMTASNTKNGVVATISGETLIQK